MALDTSPRIINVEDYPPSDTLHDLYERLANIRELACKAEAALISGMPLDAFRHIERIKEEAE